MIKYIVILNFEQKNFNLKKRMISGNFDDLLRVKELEINELHNMKIRSLQNELDDKNRRIYDLIQQNENLIFNEKCQYQSLKMQEDSVKKISKENQSLRIILEQQETKFFELTQEKEKNEKRLILEIESQELDLKKLRVNLTECLKELEFYKDENSNMEQMEKENVFQLQDIKKQLEDQVKEKENILDKIIEENSELQQKLKKFEELHNSFKGTNENSENKYQKVTNSLYKEIDSLKKQVLDFEKKLTDKKRKNETKLEKLKQNYFLYLEDYEKRHIDQMKDLKDINEGNELELRKLLMENEELKSRIRFVNENAHFSTNETVRTLENKYFDLETKFRQLNNELSKRDNEIRNLKDNIVTILREKEINEKNHLKNLETEKKLKSEEKLMCRYEESDAEGEMEFLIKIREKLKNETCYKIIEKKFTDNENLKNNCRMLGDQVEALKKENLFLGYEILKLQKQNLQLNKLCTQEQSEKNNNVLDQLSNKNQLIINQILKNKEEQAPQKINAKDNAQDFEKPTKLKNFDMKLKKHKMTNNNPATKLPRYQDFEKITGDEE